MMASSSHLWVPRVLDHCSLEALGTLLTAVIMTKNLFRIKVGHRNGGSVVTSWSADGCKLVSRSPNVPYIRVAPEERLHDGTRRTRTYTHYSFLIIILS